MLLVHGTAAVKVPVSACQGAGCTSLSCGASGGAGGVLGWGRGAEQPSQGYIIAQSAALQELTNILNVQLPEISNVSSSSQVKLLKITVR